MCRCNGSSGLMHGSRRHLLPIIVFDKWCDLCGRILLQWRRCRGDYVHWWGRYLLSHGHCVKWNSVPNWFVLYGRFSGRVSVFRGLWSILSGIEFDNEWCAVFSGQRVHRRNGPGGALHIRAGILLRTGQRFRRRHRLSGEFVLYGWLRGCDYVRVCAGELLPGTNHDCGRRGVSRRQLLHGRCGARASVQLSERILLRHKQQQQCRHRVSNWTLMRWRHRAAPELYRGWLMVPIRLVNSLTMPGWVLRTRRFVYI